MRQTLISTEQFSGFLYIGIYRIYQHFPLPCYKSLSSSSHIAMCQENVWRGNSVAGGSGSKEGGLHPGQEEREKVRSPLPSVERICPNCRNFAKTYFPRSQCGDILQKHVFFREPVEGPWLHGAVIHLLDKGEAEVFFKINPSTANY